MATYEQQMREYDERGRQIDVLAKVSTALKAAASPTSS